MVLKIIRWLRGYVVFTIMGRFPERFINLINHSGIRYWDIVPCDGGYKGSMILSDYLSIRKIARKSNVKIKSSKRVGLPFFIKNYKRRKGILIGGVCAFLIMGLLSQFIWEINFQGLNRLSSSDISSALQDSGLSVGMWKGSVNVEAVERKVTLKVPDIGWISINAINNIATVEIKEKAQKPKITKTDYPCNIKAKCDGVITKTVVYSGTCQVKKGSAVGKNQLLVSSVVEDTNENLTYVHSKADIYADVRQKKSFDIKLSDNRLIPQEKYTEKTDISFLGFNFPYKMSSSHSGEKASIYYSYCLQANGVNLPAGYIRERNYYYTNTKQKLSGSSAKKILQKQMALYECFSEGKGTVKSRKLTYKKDKDVFTMNADYTINKNISKTQRIRVEG